MQLQNIHFACEEEPVTRTTSPSIRPPATPPATPPASGTLKLRKIKVSPHEEYTLRTGDARPISDALASLICCRKGRAEIGPKGITVERKDIGGKRIYHHPDSRLCNDLSQRERKIFYVLNSLKPDIIHLLDDSGRYLESLPEKFQPGVLNTEEQKREYQDQKRQFSRVARHLQELHGEDTKQAIADLTHNASVAKGIVQVLGNTAAAPVQEPAPSPLGERIAAAENAIHTSRYTYDRAPSTDRTSTTTRDVLTRRAKPTECPF